jgi:hypothetical protein
LVSTPPVTISASSLNFGNQLVGTASPAQTITLTNNNASSVTIALAGANPGDFTQSNTCTAVAVGATCTIIVTFSPAAASLGARSAQITISAGGSPAAVIGLTGTGIQPGLAASPASLAFGIVTVGAVSAPQTVTLSNSGTAPLTLDSIAITANFTETSTCSLSPSTLAPGAGCVVTVHFAPATAGAITGSLTIASTAPGSPLVVPLSGTGVAKTKDTKDTKEHVDKIADKSVTDVVVKSGVTAVATEKLASVQPESEGTQKAFIQPEERPPVGQKARDDEGPQ